MRRSSVPGFESLYSASIALETARDAAAKRMGAAAYDFALIEGSFMTATRGHFVAVQVFGNLAFDNRNRNHRLTRQIRASGLILPEPNSYARLEFDGQSILLDETSATLGYYCFEDRFGVLNERGEIVAQRDRATKSQIEHTLIGAVANTVSCLDRVTPKTATITRGFAYF